MTSSISFKLILVSVVLASVALAQFGGGENGRRGHHGHKGGFPPLPFLRGLNKTDVREFLDIRRNDTNTKAQVKVQEDAWAAKQNATVQQIYNEFKSNMTTKFNEFKAQVEAAAQNLTAPAKAVFEQIKAVKENDNITMRDEHQQIRSIIDGTTQAIRKELKDTLPKPPRGGPKGPRGGRFGSRSGSQDSSMDSNEDGQDGQGNQGGRGGRGGNNGGAQGGRGGRGGSTNDSQLYGSWGPQ
uniref:DUF148 domain-containing protein n=1 Tax=Rhabditophanes sp. KR3021 TaxID=114890 RepID=A0AC35TM33_9BILA